MNDLNEFQQRAAAAATVKLLSGTYFSISDLDAIAKTVGRESAMAAARILEDRMKHSRIEVGGQQGRHVPPAIKDGWPAPLYTKDGGHTFRSGVVFPITEEDGLGAVPTPQEAADWTSWAMRILALVAFICGVVAVFALVKTFPIIRSYL